MTSLLKDTVLQFTTFLFLLIVSIISIVILTWWISCQIPYYKYLILVVFIITINEWMSTYVYSYIVSALFDSFPLLQSIDSTSNKIGFFSCVFSLYTLSHVTLLRVTNIFCIYVIKELKDFVVKRTSITSI